MTDFDKFTNEDDCNGHNTDSGNSDREALSEEPTSEEFTQEDEYFVAAKNYEKSHGRTVWPENPSFEDDMSFRDTRKFISRRAFAFWLILAMILTAILTSLITGFLIPKLRNAGMGNQSVTPTTYSIAKSTGSEISAEEIIAKNSPSVVEIRTEEVARDMWLNNYVKEGAGSGVIINTDGYIVTNNHVIAGARTITVTLKNQKTYNATLVGTDPETDIAVIKIKATGLKAVEFGDSKKLQMGQFVVAIGNPLGQLGGTATAGIISSLDRRIVIDGKEMELLQTDAAINPGNSGGGLFDNHGNLVGVVVAKSRGENVEGIGFAIPVNKAKPIINSLIKDGKLPQQPKVGIRIANIVDESMAKEMGLPKPGVYVTDILSNAAKSAGIMVGDRIISVDGKDIKDSQEFLDTIKNHKVGDKLKITVERNNAKIVLSVELVDMANAAQPQQ